MSENKRRTSRQPPWETGSEREAGAFGLWLRREREAREVSLDEIANVTKISKSYLGALEEERFDVLPAPVFAKGFLREYAKYVGLDPDEVVNSYLTAMQETQPESSMAEVSPARKNSFEWTTGVLLAGALVLLLGAIGFAGFWAERSQSRERAVEPPPQAALPLVDPAAMEPTVEPEEAPAVAVPVEPEPESAPAAPLVVTIDFTEDCWVEASVDGRRRLSELHVQGESLQIEAEGRVELTLGNPSGVSVEVNGEPYSLTDYRPGRVARDIAIVLEDAG
jgi:cytoskeletal protein RodZ